MTFFLPSPATHPQPPLPNFKIFVKAQYEMYSTFLSSLTFSSTLRVSYTHSYNLKCKNKHIRFPQK